MSETKLDLDRLQRLCDSEDGKTFERELLEAAPELLRRARELEGVLADIDAEDPPVAREGGELHSALRGEQYDFVGKSGAFEAIDALHVVQPFVEALESKLRAARRILRHRGDGCERCGKPLAYPGARYCGAACSAKAEAKL